MISQPASIPDFLYGTAWKEDRTAALVELALRAGFRGIDTANQRRHYFEAGVGQGLDKAFGAGILRRSELFLQTKFTYRSGQDHRLPYDPGARLSVQVAQSMASSLEHFGVDYVDSYVLHGPASNYGWTDADAEVWERDEKRMRCRAYSIARGEQCFAGASRGDDCSRCRASQPGAEPVLREPGMGSGGASLLP